MNNHAAKIIALSAVSLLNFANLCQAESINENPASGTRDGFYYFVSASNNASVFSLAEPGRFTLNLDRSTATFSGGIGWQGGSPAVIHYEGFYAKSLAAYPTHLAFNIHATAPEKDNAPRIELTILESAGGYGVVCASIMQFEYVSDGVRYYGRECNPAGNPADKKDVIWFLATRMPANRFEQINGSITLENHINAFKANSKNFTGVIDSAVLTFASSNASGLVDVTLSAGADFIIHDLDTPVVAGASSSSSGSSSNSTSSSGKPTSGPMAGAINYINGALLILLSLFTRQYRRR